MPGIKDFFKSKGADLLNAGAKFIDEVITNKEERDAAKLKWEQEANRHLEAIEAGAIELEKAYLADVQNARNMQVAALQQNDLFSKRFMYYLAAFVLISSVGYGVALLFVTVPEDNKRLVEQFADMFLLTGALMVLSFFFGSSRGQERNEETRLITKTTKSAKEG